MVEMSGNEEDDLKVKEYKNRILNAAREGQLPEIQSIVIEVKEKHDLKVFFGLYLGQTPLLLSIRNGHFEIAKFLIETCKIDVEETGNVNFDNEVIVGAPPLWCAAAAGHLNIIKLLVEHKVSINQTTKTNSTPLRAACFDGKLDIVQYLVEHGGDIEISNRHGHTCLMIASYKKHIKVVEYLLKCGADVNRKSIKGNTALHDCSESGSLPVVQLLLNHDAKQDVDSYGLTPLYAACIAGHFSIVTQFLTDRNNYKHKFNAMMLLGATYIDKHRDISRGINIWRLALLERSPESEVTSHPVTSCEYDSVTDLQTVEQLERVITDPEKIKMQSLYLREKILGPAHPDVTYYIRYRGALYADNGNMSRCIDLWMYALRMQLKYLEPLNVMTMSSFFSFGELFFFKINTMFEPDSYLSNTLSSFNFVFSNLASLFELMIYEVQRGCEMSRTVKSETDSFNRHRLVAFSLHFVSLICSLKMKVSETLYHKFMKILYDFVKSDPRGQNGDSLLHLACYHDTTSIGEKRVCTFPNLLVVKALIAAGACVTAKNTARDTPLHKIVFHTRIKEDILQCLLENGAHLDEVNSNGVSALQILRLNRSVDLNFTKYLKLSCLASQIIKSNMLPYEQILSPDLIAFVKNH